ncbi:hypothetical protein GCM10020000_79570 [Streptomyces olivoverticillatus]
MPGGEGAEQEVAELPAVDLGVAPAVLGRGGVEQDAAVAGDQAQLLALGAGQGGEAVPQAGGTEGVLSGVGVHVEGAALVAGGRGGVGFVDGDVDAVALEDAGAGQAAGSGADDGDAVHGRSPCRGCAGQGQHGRVPRVRLLHESTTTK